MYNHTLKLLGLSLVTIALTACGGGGSGSSDDSSSVQTALNDSGTTTSDAKNEDNVVTKAEPVISVEDNVVTKAEPVISVLDLDKNLSANVQESEIISTTIEGLDYASVDINDVKNLWTANSFVSIATNQRYVAPRCKDTAATDAICGRISNTGLTKDSPWDLYSVGRNNHIIPSDTIIWMKPGKYSSPLDEYRAPLDNTTPIEISLSGEYNKPIHFRPYQGQYTGVNNGVQIDGGIKLIGDWIWFWEVEMTPIVKKSVQISSDIYDYDYTDWRPNTSPLEYYFDSSGYPAIHAAAPVRLEPSVYGGDNSKVINIIGHGNGEGIGVWKPASNFEVYGSIFYDNGWIDQSRAHGHAMYMQNNSGTERLVSDNLIGGNLGYGFQAWGSETSFAEDFTIVGNAFFAHRKNGLNEVLIAFDTSRNMKVNNNFFSGGGVQFPYTASAAYAANPNPAAYNREFKSNMLYDAAHGIDYDANENTQIMHSDFVSAQARSVIRPNKYDPRRANLMVFNPKQKSEISVSLAEYAKKGDRIVVFNPFRPHAPLEYGTYNGKNLTISWPDKDWDIVSYSDAQGDNASKEFWAFVLINVGQ